MTDEIKQIIKANDNNLDFAKPHTEYKIKYIKSYVRHWLYVAVNAPKSNINFIDCMCNAGVYKNNLFCTCIEVLNQYKENAIKYPEKNFNLFVNDNNEERINILKQVVKSLAVDEISNINVFYENIDVVQYLKGFSKYHVDNWTSFNLLYVDPYNFGIDSLLDAVYEFLNNYYCELFYNFFSSDITRNTNNQSAKNKSQQIVKGLSGVINEIDTNDFDVYDLMLKIQNKIKSSKNINFSFSYQFKTVTKNVELYYIMFFTPSLKGLECVKQAIWEVFKGEPSFSKNFYESKDNPSLFDMEDILIEAYSTKLQPELIEIFKRKEVNYEDLQKYILENTLLRSGQIKKNVLDPMIARGDVKKMNYFGKRNYSKDSFIFK